MYTVGLCVLHAISPASSLVLYQAMISLSLAFSVAETVEIYKHISITNIDCNGEGLF